VAISEVLKFTKVSRKEDNVKVYTKIEKRIWVNMEYEHLRFKTLSITKAFTTKRKKASLVLRRCLDFIYNRVLEGYQREIPAKVFDLKFKEEIGWDRITLKKYLGNNKRIFLMDGMGKKRPFRDEHEPGAFERFGLLERIPHSTFHYETLAWKITPYFWIKLKELYPQRKIAEWFSKQQYEGVGVESGNISLTERKQTIESDSIETTKNNNNNNSERDIFFGELTEEELAILTAKPSVKKCVDCGRINASNPYRVLCRKGLGMRSRSDVCVLEGEP
jgi:hypothetical protein